jgi:hypothetical protein
MGDRGKKERKTAKACGSEDTEAGAYKSEAFMPAEME